MQFPSEPMPSESAPSEASFRELVQILHKKTTDRFMACENELFDLVNVGLLLEQTIPILFDFAMAEMLRDLTIQYPTMEEALAALKLEGTSEGTLGGDHVI